MAIGAVALLAVSFNAVRFWEYSIERNGSGIIRIELILLLNNEYKLWYLTIASHLTIYMIPLIVLIIFNILIKAELKKAITTRLLIMTSAQKADRRTTMMMSAVVMGKFVFR